MKSCMGLRTVSKRVVMAYVGMVNGVRAYSAIDAESERHLNAQEIVVADLKSGKGKRTGLQNASIHLYLTHLVNAFNDAGLDMTAVMSIISKGVGIPWSMSAAKERLWRPTQLATYGTESTTKLDSDQVGSVYEALNQVTSERLGIGVSFPDRFSLMYEEDLKNGR